MPKHDLPDGNEAGSNLIDFREHLRRRTDRTLQDNGDPETGPLDRESYRLAEYGDGTPPRFRHYGPVWIAMVLAFGWIIWVIIRR
ncbi:hypothetical protein [Sphingomonas abietis]|uniref:Uncharacterized protein n=1 Tax=Sphingomonas abietis TaxID=3012344 RepID=A0ABY7NJN8_9SPHN|nr:hypothetical protein [Sphingomonas abietis]WBO20731.1 hypothetical protein PBT88_10945 [Sphingomonas abietis]